MAVFATWSIQTECAFQSPNGTWGSTSYVFTQLSGSSLILGIATWSLSAASAKKPKTTPKGYAPRKGIPRNSRKKNVVNTRTLQQGGCTNCEGKRKYDYSESLQGTGAVKRPRVDGLVEMIEQVRRRWDPDRIKTRKEDWKEIIRVQRERVKLAEVLLVESVTEGGKGGDSSTGQELAPMVEESTVSVQVVEDIPAEGLSLWTGGMEGLFSMELLDVLGQEMQDTYDGIGMDVDWSMVELEKWALPADVSI